MLTIVQKTQREALLSSQTPEDPRAQCSDDSPRKFLHLTRHYPALGRASCTEVLVKVGSFFMTAWTEMDAHHLSR